MLPAALSALLAPTPMQPVMCSCNRRVRTVVHLHTHASARQIWLGTQGMPWGLTCSHQLCMFVSQH